MPHALTIAGWVLATLAVAGTGYQCLTAWLVVRRLGMAAPASPDNHAAVSVLKPLHGGEPRLAANLASFLEQDFPCSIQLVCGVQDSADAAVATVGQLHSAWPGAVALVVDPSPHGRNRKIGNLSNLLPAAGHDILVISDSDIAVPRDYLHRVIAALGEPGTGAVTCLYHGRGDAGLWSRLGAMGISYGFLLSVVTGHALGLADPCMGSTIALSRATLDRIGGFAAFADVLADDYAIGAAVRRLGLKVAVPGFTVIHACAEASFAALVRHELRWNVTVRRLDPPGFAGAGLVNPVPIALLAMLCLGMSPLTAGVLAAALASRIAVAACVDRVTAARSGPWLLLPVRDCLTFGLFLMSFLVQAVDWRGAKLTVARDGRITAS